MMLDDAEECQLSGPIGELVPFNSKGRALTGRPDPDRPGARCCLFGVEF